MGHNIQQKEKNWSQSNMIRSCLSSFMLQISEQWNTMPKSNEGFWEISYMRLICNLLLERQKKGWTFLTSCQTCLSSPFVRVFGGGKELVGNFHNYSFLLKNCASLFSLSLFEINTTQCLVDWDSLTLTLFGGKKEEIRVSNFLIVNLVCEQPGIH